MRVPVPLLQDRCQTRNPGPTRMLMSHGGTSHGSHEHSRQSRGRVMTVTNPTWISHGWNKSGPWYSASAASKPLRAGQHAGSPYLCGTRCGVQNSVTELRNLAHGPSCHRSGTCCAHISPRYAGRSIIGDNGKISQLLPISTNCCLFLIISTY